MVIKENKKEIIESITLTFEDAKIEFKCFDGVFYDRWTIDLLKTEYNMLLHNGTTLCDVVFFINTLYLWLNIDHNTKEWESYVNDLILNDLLEEHHILIGDKKTLDYMISNLLKDNMK
jgi:hypothetical protein